MLVGSLQLPIVLILKKHLGGSTSMSAMLAQLFVGPLEKLSPYAAQFRRWSVDTLWQVLVIETLKTFQKICSV